MYPLVIGVDFGTDSVRAELVDASTGAELSAGVAAYPRWAEGRFCDPGAKMFRQHPLDYVEAFERSLTGALRSAPEGSAARVRAVSIDTTGSTPCAVDRAGTPLSLRPEFAENPNAMFVLWKDHTAVREAEEINPAPVPGAVSTTLGTRGASTRQNGSGPRSCTFSGRTQRFVPRHTRGWSTATGSRRS